MCVYMQHLHIHAPHAPPITTKYKIYLVDLPSVLYERSGQNETSVLNQLFLWLSGAFHVLLMKAPLFIQEVPFFMKTIKTRSICVYTCTIYTYMHHQIPPKYKIYLVGLPSVLYERPGQNETSVLNQLFLLIFRCFSCAFYEKVPLFMKTNKTRSICVYTCTIYTYRHHQIPPITTKYKIYLIELPLVLYERSGQNETSVLNQLFLWLSGAFHVLLMKAPLFIQEVPLFMKTIKTRSVCVYTCTIYTYMHHQIPPKYKIYLVGLPSVLYERPGQNETSVLSQLFLLLFRWFSCAFHEKVPLFMKTKKTRSIYVYTYNIYTYMHHMHHQLPPNIRYT